jgi:hypothetical protein
MKPGDKVYLAREIVEPADGDHPTFLMGVQGEQVTIVDYLPERPTLKYLVEGPTNPGKPWYATREDLMYTKPFYFNSE